MCFARAKVTNSGDFPNLLGTLLESAVEASIAERDCHEQYT